MCKFLKQEQGSVAVEYSLFVSLIGLVVAGALLAFGPQLHKVFSSLQGSVISVQMTDDPKQSNPEKIVDPSISEFSP